MDIYNNIIDVYNSNSKKIIETFKNKKNKTKENIGNMNIHKFYIIISILIIFAVILPLILIYTYQSKIFKIMFNFNTNIEDIKKIDTLSDSKIDTSVYSTSELTSETNTTNI